MELPFATPTNRFLVPQRDRRWPHVLSSVLLVSTVVLLVLFLIGWPRLKSTSVHYGSERLRAEVVELERQERRLRLALEHERSPAPLAERGRDLGLAPPGPGDLERAPVLGGGP